MTKARRRDFELQSSELWGNKNDLSAQLQIQLIGFEPHGIASLVRPAISHPASQPAGWPKTKHQLAGRPATNQAPAGRPAGRHKTKNQLATVAPAEAKRQPASQPDSQPASQPAWSAGRPAGQKPSPANEMNECIERND